MRAGVKRHSRAGSDGLLVQSRIERTRHANGHWNAFTTDDDLDVSRSPGSVVAARLPCTVVSPASEASAAMPLPMR